MTSFSEMNQVKVGFIGAALIALILFILFNLTQFAFLTGSTTYRAAFANAAGLEIGDKVRMGGAPVGKVRDIELAANKVVVSFDVDSDAGTPGSATAAAIKTETILGRKYLEFSPQGSGELDPDTEIPLQRTSVPYNLTDQLDRLAATTGQIDTERLARSFDTLADAFKDSPPQMREALQGLTRLSQMISSRDGELQQLLGNAESVTGVLADRNHQLTKLVVDGNTLLAELQQRRQLIHQMLVNVEAVSKQVSGLVHDNQAQMGPLLKNLDSVLGVLRRNEGNITVALQKLGPFAASLGEAIASGPFWNAYIHNLNVVPLPPGVPASSAGIEGADQGQGGN